VHIKTSASIRSNYNDIANLCKSTGEPVYLTKNGVGDLVVMDIEAFEQRAEDLKNAENLHRIRTARLSGARGYTVAEARESLYKSINNVNGE